MQKSIGFAALVYRRNLRLMYVELHSCSAFSFLEGASLPEDLVSEAARLELPAIALLDRDGDRKSTRLNSSHGYISYAVFCLKKKKKQSKSRDYVTVALTSVQRADSELAGCLRE